MERQARGAHGTQSMRILPERLRHRYQRPGPADAASRCAVAGGTATCCCAGAASASGAMSRRFSLDTSLPAPRKLQSLRK